MNLKNWMKVVKDTRKVQGSLDKDQKKKALEVVYDKIWSIAPGYQGEFKSINNSVLVERFKLGIFLLDIMASPDWHNKIDLEKLEMSSPSRDILAQLYGSYVKGCKELNIAGNTFYLGLNAARKREIKFLNILWTQEIIKRKKDESE